jgi:catechol 2,3-dioxygenase-like lactoylglutathione lyase family enzyme
MIPHRHPGEEEPGFLNRHETKPAKMKGGPAVATVSVRYIVEDVGEAIEFYASHLGFGVEFGPGPGFAILSRGDLRLLLNAPGAGGAGQATPDGRKPEPGGWNRIQLEVQDLAGEVEGMRGAGARFRNEIVIGNGGKQILLEDPSGNPVELFEPPRG